MAFKKYKNIILLFYKIVSQADTDFTESECEKFFKSIIKYAKRRFNLEEKSGEKRRASSSKKRPHNLTYKKVTCGTDNNETDTSDGQNSEEDVENELGNKESNILEDVAIWS